MHAAVQTSFVQSVHAASVEIFYRQMLLGDGRTSKVDARQKETWLTGNANKDFHFVCNLPTESIDFEPAAALL